MNRGSVLCVTSNFPRWQGDSTTPFVLNLARDLTSLGWSVDVLAPHAAGAAVFENLEDINVHRFRYAWPDTAETVCYQGGALVNLRRNPIDRLKLPSLVMAQLFSMMRLLAGGKYDLIHSHWILPQGFNGALMRRLFSIPHILTVHGGDIFGLKGRLMLPFKKIALSGTDRITVNSSFTEQAVRSLLNREKHVMRIPMGVDVRLLSEADTELSSIVRERFRHGEGPLLIFVGRLVEEKGIGDLLQAVRLLSDRLPELRLIVVGAGQEEPRFKMSTQALGISDQVHFVGWIDPKEIRGYMASADIFCGPSKRASDGWVEAQGLTFLEAMASGVPVIATNSGGVVDAVIDGETGLTVPENNPHSLAEAIATLWSNPGLRRKLVDQGLEKVTTEFSRSQCAQRFSELFLSLNPQNW